MDSKFTIRDLLVYFVTGTFFSFSLLGEFGDTFLAYFKIQKNEVKDLTAIILPMLAIGMYVIGHFIQGLDDFLTIISKFLFEYFAPKRQNKFLKIFYFISYVLYAYRINGLILVRKQDVATFWINCNLLHKQSKYEKAEYWNILHSLMEGILTSSLVWFLYFYFYKSNSNPTLSIIYFVFVFIFWFKSKHIAGNFIDTVNYSTT